MISLRLKYHVDYVKQDDTIFPFWRFSHRFVEIYIRVGEKVANCVLLFGLGRREAFPVDVWMKRICEYLYFGEDTPKNVIEEYATDKFGRYAGYAQQYLFIYGQEHKIGK